MADRADDVKGTDGVQGDQGVDDVHGDQGVDDVHGVQGVDGGEERQQIERKAIERRWIRIASVAVVAIVLAAFIVDNSQSVEVGFLFFKVTTPLFWVLIVTALLGVVLDRLIRWRRSS